MNWDHYFYVVKTYEDFCKLRSTGMMYELFPIAPSTWSEHVSAKLALYGRIDEPIIVSKGNYE